MVNSLSQRIRRCREEAGLTQQQLADAVGISRAAVTMWENGDTKEIRAEHIFKAARALKKNAEWLVTGEGSEMPNGMLRDLMHDLPTESGQQVLDFIEYRINKAEDVLTSSRLTHYMEMIEHFKRDMIQRDSQKGK